METNELLEIRILITVIAKKSMHALEQRLNLTSKGISRLQYRILHALNHQQHTISELSDKFMLDPSTLVPAVDALERKGLARRGKDPDDRRRVPLSLTEHGSEIITDVHLLDKDDLLIKSLAALGDEQCLELLTLLRELVRCMPEGEDILRKVSSGVSLYQRS